MYPFLEHQSYFGHEGISHFKQDIYIYIYIYTEGNDGIRLPH